MKPWQIAALAAGGLGVIALAAGGKKDKNGESKGSIEPKGPVKKSGDAKRSTSSGHQFPRDPHGYEASKRLEDLVFLLNHNELRLNQSCDTAGDYVLELRQRWTPAYLQELIDDTLKLRKRIDSVKQISNMIGLDDPSQSASVQRLMFIDNTLNALRAKLDQCADEGSEKAAKALSHLSTSGTSKPKWPDVFTPEKFLMRIQPVNQPVPVNNSAPPFPSAQPPQNTSGNAGGGGSASNAGGGNASGGQGQQ